MQLVEHVNRAKTRDYYNFYPIVTRFQFEGDKTFKHYEAATGRLNRLPSNWNARLCPGVIVELQYYKSEPKLGVIISVIMKKEPTINGLIEMVDKIFVLWSHNSHNIHV